MLTGPLVPRASTFSYYLYVTDSMLLVCEDFAANLKIMSDPELHTAAVIIIGNEILSGRTKDQNLDYIGQRLDKLGITLMEARIIPDDEKVIVETINSLRQSFTYVFTTGGIGPTHDDITSASVAKAFSVQLEENPEAVQSLKPYYDEGRINDARMKMALIPEGAVLIKNPVSGAPGFQLDNVFVLPGVPLILKAMFEGIEDRLIGGAPILSESVTCNLREGQIAGALGKIQNNFPVVSIGSYPFFKRSRLGVNLVLRSRDESALQLAANEVRQMVQALGGKLYEAP